MPRMHTIKLARTLAAAALITPVAFAMSDTAKAVDKSIYEGRKILPDPTESLCDVEKSLVHVKDNLWRHTNGSFPATHSGLVLITNEGALVVDAGNTCVARWLQDEIKAKFGKDIKYVVQTHAHFDHLAGTQVWQKAGATVIAQRNAIEPIIGEKLPVATPDRVFDNDAEIELGGEKVLLHHEPAGSHSNSMVQVVFPKQRAMQCTDVCQAKTFPYMDFLDFYYDGWIKTLDWVAAQEVDVIDIGHYNDPATKADIAALRAYMVDLHDQVLALSREGKNWDQLWRNVKAGNEHKKDWFGYDFMRWANIQGMHRWVDNHRRGVW